MAHGKRGSGHEWSGGCPSSVSPNLTRPTSNPPTIHTAGEQSTVCAWDRGAWLETLNRWEGGSHARLCPIPPRRSALDGRTIPSASFPFPTSTASAVFRRHVAGCVCLLCRGAEQISLTGSFLYPPASVSLLLCMQLREWDSQSRCALLQL